MRFDFRRSCCRASTLFAFLMLFGADLANAQTSSSTWTLLPNSPDSQAAGGGRHDDVFFIDPDTGWLVNTRGQIWKTTDGGDSWTLQLDKGMAARFRSVGFATDQIGWAGTVFSPQEMLYETRNGGTTWTDITNRISGNEPSGICGMSIVNENVAFGVGAFFGEPYLIRTINGGQNWFSFSLAQHTATLIDVHFFDEQNGFAVGGTGTDLDGQAVILKTTSGGLTWSRVFTSNREKEITGEWGWKISFPSRDVGYVSVEYRNDSQSRPAKVLKTTNGGQTWTEMWIDGSTELAGLQGIGFLTEDVGWISGRGTTSLTTDGGASWKQVPPYSPAVPNGELDGSVNRVRVVNDTLAYAIGTRVYKFTGNPQTVDVEGYTAQPKAFSMDQNYPNPFSPRTTIAYRLHRPADVRIEVYDLRGRQIRTLVDQLLGPGGHTVSWDGRDDAGKRVASGTYMYIMDIGDSTEMKQMVLLR